MIVRVWHGWTTPEQADAYQELLESTIFPGIAGMGVRGFRDIDLLRRDTEDGEVEFVTIMRFDGWDAVVEFAGEDHETSVVPPAAQQLLSRYDDRSQHYRHVTRRTAQ